MVMFMINYWMTHIDKFTDALLDHLEIVGVSVGISIIIAIIITLLVKDNRKVSDVIISIFSAVYAIPSLALFAILIPITGLGFNTTVIVLVVYNQFLLLRNFITGINEVDPAIVEAARGMGMTGNQIFVKIQLPLATPLILAGIRLSVVSTIGIATIAATIGAGGIGEIMFQGLRSMNMAKIIGGTLLCVIMALIANLVLFILGKILPHAHTEKISA